MNLVWALLGYTEVEINSSSRVPGPEIRSQTHRANPLHARPYVHSVERTTLPNANKVHVQSYLHTVPLNGDVRRSTKVTYIEKRRSTIVANRKSGPSWRLRDRMTNFNPITHWTTKRIDCSSHSSEKIYQKTYLGMRRSSVKNPFARCYVVPSRWTNPSHDVSDSWIYCIYIFFIIIILLLTMHSEIIGIDRYSTSGGWTFLDL